MEEEEREADEGDVAKKKGETSKQAKKGTSSGLRGLVDRHAFLRAVVLLAVLLLAA